MRLSGRLVLFLALATGRDSLGAGPVLPVAEAQPLASQRIPLPRIRPQHGDVLGSTTRPPRVEDGSEYTVYLVTAGQGDAIWEKFGHTAIWIHDSVKGTDVAYNWGIFDFAQPGFMRRFLQGHMVYWMAPFDAPGMMREYIAADRSLWIQRLHLSPTQRTALHDFVEWNARDENKYYRYDYYRDNCSTRVRNVFDRVLGGQIRQATDTIPTHTTYRWHTRRLLQGNPAAYAGIELGSGHPADQPISRWAEMFLPVAMHDAFNTLRVRDAGTGELVPFVESDRQIFRASRSPEPTAPPHWTIYFLLTGVALGCLFAALGRAGANGSAAARVGLASLGAIWSLVIGLLGTFLIFAWTLTDHVFTHNNENVLQANPLSLALAILLPIWLFRRAAGRAARGMALVIALLCLIGLVAHAFPWFNQVNEEIIALMLPAQFGLALALCARERGAAVRPMYVQPRGDESLGPFGRPTQEARDGLV